MNNQEINIAVARKLGWELFDCEGKCNHAFGLVFVGPHWHKPGKEYWGPQGVLDYAESIQAAWEVWEKMSECYFLTLETEAGKFRRNIVKVWKNDKTGAEWVIEDVYEDTAPLAICLAFLKLP